MIVRESEQQMEFSDQFFHPADDPVPDDHKYLRLRDAIGWEKVLGELESSYSENEGRPSIPLKNMVILLLIKHLEQLSDRALIEKLSGSMPMQKALNIAYRDAQDYCHHSLLTHFRARIGESGVNIIADAVEDFVKKKG